MCQAAAVLDGRMHSTSRDIHVESKPKDIHERSSSVWQPQPSTVAAPSNPSGAEPSAPCDQAMAGGNPHFMSSPAHCTKAGLQTPQH